MARNSIADIAASVARKHKLGKKESVDIVSAFFRIVSEGLRDERLVKVRGLGTFKVMAVKARESVNVNTGERVVIEGHDKVSFVPDATMKELVNKPFAQFTTVVVNDGVNFDSIDAASEAEQQKNETVAAEVSSEPIEEETPIIAEREKAVEEPQPDKNLHAEESPASDGSPVLAEAKPANSNILAEKEEANRTPTANEAPVSQGKEVKNNVTESETVKQKVVEKEIVRQQIVEQKVIKQERHTLNDTENRDDGSVSRDYFDEQVDAYERRLKRGRIVACLLVLAGLAAGFFVGQYCNGLWSGGNDVEQTPIAARHDSVKEPAKQLQPAKEDNMVADSQQTADKEVPRNRAVGEKQEHGQVDLKTVNADRRLKYGAYEITGIDKTVVLKHGQTIENYARRHFGSDEMKVYIQALNGVDDMAEGDTMLVPKIRLRQQYRR